MRPEPPPPRTPGRARALELLAVFLVALGFHLWLEFRRAGLHGVDGYYHLKVALLYARGELSLVSSDFPWATRSILNDLYCDWQLGYHLLLVPFTACGLLLGGKLATALFAALIPSIVHAILRAHRVPLAWAFPALLLLSSEYYLIRVHLPRPTSPVIALLLIALHLASTRRHRALLVCLVGVFLVYAVPHTLLLLAVVALLAFLIAERRLPLRLLGTVLAAVVLGVLAHPGTWRWRGDFLGADHGLFRVWEQMRGSLAASEAGDRIEIEGEWVVMQAPAEFRPPPLDAIPAEVPLPLVVFAVGLVVGGLLLARRFSSRARDPGEDDRLLLPLLAGGMACATFLLFLQHVRFAEYWIPFSVLALGATWGAAPLGRRGRTVVGGVLVVALGLTAPGTVAGTLERIRTSPAVGLAYEGPMTWLAENTEEDAVVFHGKWPQFSPMLFFNDRNRYLVGLDPYFFYQHDAAEYARWVALSLGALEPEATRAGILAFGARHALVKRGDALDAVLRRAPRTLPMYEDGIFRVYELEP
jgi:hypothetical protein